MAQATIDTTVTGLQGIPLAATAPAVNQALVFNGTSWVPTTQNFLPLSGGTITGQLGIAASGSINSQGPATVSGLNVTGQSTLTGPEIINLTGTGLPAAPSTSPLWMASVGGPNQIAMLIDNWGGGTSLVFRSASGTPSAPASLTAGALIGQIAFWGYGSSGYISGPTVGINCNTINAWSAADNSSALTFWVTPPASTAIRQVFVLSNGGSNFNTNLTINAANVTGPSLLLEPTGAADSAIQWNNASGTNWAIGLNASGFYINRAASTMLSFLNSSGQADFANSVLSNGWGCRSGVGGATQANNFNISWTGGYAQLWIDNVNQGNINVSSDYRIKRNVKVLGNMWTKVKALRPISYIQAEYTPEIVAVRKDQDTSVPMFPADDIERWGFVAHELQETLIPSAASGVKDQPDLIQSPNPLTLLACVTKALQEAMSRIEILEGKLARA